MTEGAFRGYLEARRIMKRTIENLVRRLRIVEIHYDIDLDDVICDEFATNGLFERIRAEYFEDRKTMPISKAILAYIEHKNS